MARALRSAAHIVQSLMECGTDVRLTAPLTLDMEAGHINIGPLRSTTAGLTEPSLGPASRED